MTILELVTRGYEHYDDAQVLQQVGYELESRSRLAIAEKMLRRAIDLDPTGVREAYISLAFALLRSNADRDAEAVQVLRRGVEATASPLIRVWQAGLEEDPARAAAAFSELESIDDNAIRLSIASAMMWQNMREDALRLLRQAIPVINDVNDTLTIDAFLSVASALQRAAQFDLTTVAFAPLVERLIELAPSSYGTYACGVGVYRSVKDYPSAIDVARRGLLDMPDDENLMMFIGDCYLQLDDLRYAEHWLLRAIGAKPSFIGARIILARAYNKAERIEDALGLIREFPIVNPDYAWGLVMGGALLWSRDLRSEAVDMARGAVGRLPAWAMQSIASNETYTALWDAVTTTHQN